MSWWWENIHSENAYPVYVGLGRILNRTGWCSGSWTNIGFRTAGSPPAAVGDVLAGAPFNISLSLGTGWGAKPSGQLAVANPDSAGYASASLNAFVHGTAHADLRVPLRLHAWLTNNARLVMHLNSVSSGSIMSVRADGVELSLELDLRGKRAEEVEPVLDGHLNEASLCGLCRVHIIHGIGTGTVRQIVREMLASHPLVTSFQPCEQGEGGDGVTIVSL